ncbi:MAG: hypothetical protein Q4B21_07420, partial [Bacteroidia bacterium]|nr:hypothetical protein [Bacteroidia bacterium]
MQTIDSLKQIIENECINISDIEEIENGQQEAESELNYTGSEEFIGVEPGSNPDSLLTEWYQQKKLS